MSAGLLPSGLEPVGDLAGVGLGAGRIVAREELAEAVKRLLESETWADCVDAVGGAKLARILGQMK